MDRRKANPIGCALYLDGQHTNHVELEASSDFHFNGAKPFAIEAWVRPHARPKNTDAEALKAYRFGGVVFSKYNRARRGQYFFQLEPDGRVFSPRSRAVGIEVDCYYPRRVLHARRGDLRSWTIENLHQRYAAWVTKRSSGTRLGDERLIGAIHDQDKPAAVSTGKSTSCESGTSIERKQKSSKTWGKL